MSAISIDPIDIAETFIAHWNANRVEDAIAMLSVDVLYDNVPLPDITGRDNVRDYLLNSEIGLDFRADWKILNIAAAGNVVLNERVDNFHHFSGGGVISMRVMGTLTVEDGMITIWRDYFDAAEFDRQLAEIRH